MFAGLWNENLSTLDDLLHVAVYDLQIIVSELETQKNGVQGIIDFENFSLRKVRDVTPSYAKKLASLVQVSVIGINAMDETISVIYHYRVLFPWRLKECIW